MPRRAPLIAIKALKSATQTLEMAPERCAIPREHVEAVRLFLDTYVRPNLHCVIAALEGNDKAMNDLHQDRGWIPIDRAPTYDRERETNHKRCGVHYDPPQD